MCVVECWWREIVLVGTKQAFQVRSWLLVFCEQAVQVDVCLREKEHMSMHKKGHVSSLVSIASVRTVSAVIGSVKGKSTGDRSSDWPSEVWHSRPTKVALLLVSDLKHTCDGFLHGGTGWWESHSHISWVCRGIDSTAALGA